MKNMLAQGNPWNWHCKTWVAAPCELKQVPDLLSSLYKTSFSMFVALAAASGLVTPPTAQKRPDKPTPPHCAKGTLVLLTTVFPVALTVVPHGSDQ